MKYSLIIGFLFSFIGFSQTDSSEVILSFNTLDGRKVVLSLNEAKHELHFFYGTDLKTEINLIDDLNDSIEVFSCSGYFRGGGVENSGLDLNYIHFDYLGFHYTIFDEYSADDDVHQIGLRKEPINEGKLSAIEEIHSIRDVIGGLNYQDFEDVLPKY